MIDIIEKKILSPGNDGIIRMQFLFLMKMLNYNSEQERMFVGFNAGNVGGSGPPREYIIIRDFTFTKLSDIWNTKPLHACLAGLHNYV